MMTLSVAMALSGLEADHWTGDLKDLYWHGASLIDDKPLSPAPSMASSTCASSYSTESGYGSLSPNSNFLEMVCISGLCSPNELIMTEYKNMQSCDNGLRMEKEQNEETAEEKKPAVDPSAEKIMYQNRNILDLSANLRNSWKYQATILPGGVLSYFENRSQYSRLNDACPPGHMMVTCRADSDCLYREPYYY